MIVLGSGLYVFALFDIQERNQRVHGYENDIRVKEGERERLDAMTNLAEQIGKDRELVEGYSLPSEGVAGLLETVEGLSVMTKSKVEIVSVAVRARPSDVKGEFEEVNLAVTLEGDFQHVYHGLSLLETLPYPVSMNQVRLEARKDGKKTTWTGSAMVSVLKQI